MKLPREIKTAILIIGCIIIFIFGFNYLKGTSLLSNEKTIHTLYDEVEGLVVGANVTIRGLNVGKVKIIDFNDDFAKIKVTFSIRDDLNFSNESVAQLYEAGLIGGKAIAIIPKYDSSKIIKNGDILFSEIKPGLTELVNQQIAPLQDKIEGLLTSADSLFAGISNVMNYETQNNLKMTLEGLASTIENVNILSSNINDILNANEKDLKATINNLSKVSGNLYKITDSLKQMPLASTVKNFEDTSLQLKEIIARMNSGEGSAGMILNDNKLYDNLVNSSEALEALLSDLKSHPKKYVHFSIFGRKEKNNDN